MAITNSIVPGCCVCGRFGELVDHAPGDEVNANGRKSVAFGERYTGPLSDRAAYVNGRFASTTMAKLKPTFRATS